MNILNLNIKNFLGATMVASMLFAGTVTLSSCGKTEGCTDPAAANYDADATDDDGSCTYCGCDDATALNYDSTATCNDGSCTYARDQFIGSYAANEVCTSGNYSYNMSIAAGTQNTITIVLTNLGDFQNTTLNATVNNSNITIASQTITANGTSIVISGTGNKNGNTLTINYGATYNGTTDNCTVTAIKQ